jgi:NAD(P)H-dependent flavin oxidoreductase YrpB (nitropropane dioxygenase family)
VLNHSCDAGIEYRNASGYGSGADGVQVGSRFAASVESSAHINFKDTIIEVKKRYAVNF